MSIVNITPRETELQKQVIELAESLRNIGWEFELYKQGARNTHQKLLDEIHELKAKLAELDKPEPVAYRHGFDGYGWLYTDNGDGSSWRDNVPTDAEPLYAAPTERNCKFPTCHSQEYQNKLVQVILGQEPEPYAWVFVPHNELLWPDEVEHKTPCEATGYIPLYTKGTP